MIRVRAVAAGSLLAAVVYSALATWGLWPWISSGEAPWVVAGVSAVLLPVIGLGLALREVRFGIKVQDLDRVLQEEGQRQAGEMPARPAGKPIRDEADVRFTFLMRDVERQPGDWRTWYRLSLAYRDSGDRTRARRTMIQAVSLFEAERN
jgi:cytochrome c-type biogenesis protein CcmH/NrfG